MEELPPEDIEGLLKELGEKEAEAELGEVEAESEEPSVPTDPEASLKSERRPTAVLMDDSLPGKETKPQGPTKSGEFPRDFVLAFGGWFVLHSIYWLLFDFVGRQMGEGAIILMPCLLVPPAINLVVVLILLVRRRKQTVYGVVSAILVNGIGCLFVVSSDAIFYAGSMFPFFLVTLLENSTW